MKQCCFASKESHNEPERARNFLVDNENAAGIAVGQTTGFMTVMVSESDEERAKEVLKKMIN